MEIRSAKAGLKNKPLNQLSILRHLASYQQEQGNIFSGLSTIERLRKSHKFSDRSEKEPYLAIQQEVVSNFRSILASRCGASVLPAASALHNPEKRAKLLVSYHQGIKKIGKIIFRQFPSLTVPLMAIRDPEAESSVQQSQQKKRKKN